MKKVMSFLAIVCATTSFAEVPAQCDSGISDTAKRLEYTGLGIFRIFKEQARDVYISLQSEDRSQVFEGATFFKRKGTLTECFRQDIAYAGGVCANYQCALFVDGSNGTISNNVYAFKLNTPEPLFIRLKFERIGSDTKLENVTGAWVYGDSINFMRFSGYRDAKSLELFLKGEHITPAYNRKITCIAKEIKDGLVLKYSCTIAEGGSFEMSSVP